MKLVTWRRIKGLGFHSARCLSIDYNLWYVIEFIPKCTCLYDPNIAGRIAVNSKRIGSYSGTHMPDIKFIAKNIISEVWARFAV